MKVDEILDRARAATGSTSDRALSKYLGLSHGAVANWRRGYSHPDTVTCERLAGITGIPLARVLGIVGEARAISREEKAVWRKLAATALLLLFVVVPYFNTAAANTAPGYSTQGDLCIMRSIRHPQWSPTHAYRDRR